MSKVRLNVLAISDGGKISGAYVLILEEQDGKRRIPIVIGEAEAQSIALCLEQHQPPRPLTHDLFFTFADSFNIELLEVNISEFKNGVFYSNLVFFDGEREVVIDSRTSDAIALALRFKCPIFAAPSIMFETSVEMNDNEPASEKNYSREELLLMQSKAIEAEDYETASKIRDELKKRGNA